MTMILLAVAVYTILGGMISVLITDYLQFVIMSIGLIIVVGLLVVKFGWFDMLASLNDNIGNGAFNPFDNGNYHVYDTVFDNGNGYSTEESLVYDNFLNRYTRVGLQELQNWQICQRCACRPG